MVNVGLVIHRVNNTKMSKIADFRVDARSGNALLCFWERHLTFVFHWSQTPKQTTRCGGPA